VRRNAVDESFASAEASVGDERCDHDGTACHSDASTVVDWGGGSLFLRQLSYYLNRKMLVIWDQINIDRAEEVKALLACGWAGLIHLEEFPASAPELNPDEGVWQHLKQVELAICVV
jgi:hypothetical protein